MTSERPSAPERPRADETSVADKTTTAPAPPPETTSPPPEQILELVAKLSAARYRGPLPPPEILQGYDQLVPGSAKRIFDIFERQADHRMSLEQKVVGSDIQRSWAGLAAGTVITLAIVWLAAQLVENGNTLAAAALAALDISSLAGVFVYGTRERRLERERKAEVMSQAGPPPQEGDVGLDRTEAAIEARRRDSPANTQS
ncbi:MAG TPA: DUF2335 domain-containing protein [Candidatus Limnocylindria bacterium]|nr:DUF2335 domain-containing protein [Candidatus Limnocylindria bacterium]